MGTVKTPIVMAASQEHGRCQGSRLLREAASRMLIDEA